MAKLTVYQFSELTKEQQKSVITKLGAEIGAGYTPDCLTGKFPSSEVNVEVVLDEDGTIYDIRVFDPFHFINTGGHIPLYIGPDGWSGWLLDYHDPAGNDINTILQDQDGYVVSSYCTVDERDPHLFYIYLDELKSYWVEYYGQESWDKAQYEDLDLEIQQNDPELWGCGDGFNDKGQYLTYTTDPTSPDIL